MRRIVLLAMVSSFFILGLLDLASGRTRTGIAGLLLGVVQALLFL